MLFRFGTAITLTFRLLDSNGAPISTVTRSFGAGNQMAQFAHELFPGLPDDFKGLIEVSGSGPIVAVTLKITTNSRNEPVLTTLPVADLTQSSTTTKVVFPQIAVGGAFSTQLIFLNPDKTNAASGNLRFYKTDGTDMTPLGVPASNQLPFRFAGGAGSQINPGQAASGGAIFLLDPITGNITDRKSTRLNSSH